MIKELFEKFVEWVFLIFFAACLFYLALEITDIKSKVDAIHQAVAVEEAK